MEGIWARRSRGEAPALMLEQPALACEPTAITCQGAVGADHAVAWHDDAVRILSVRGADRPCRRRDAEAGGKRAVGRRIARRDLAQRRPNALLKRRSAARALHFVHGAQAAMQLCDD